MRKLKMTEPDYKIEEIFNRRHMKVYFRVYSMPNYKLIGPPFSTLEEATECVRLCRKHKDPIWHYVED